MNTTLSAATCGISVFLLTFVLTRKYDVGALCNGILSGLVSITAGCGNMECGSAVLTGFIGAFFYQAASSLLVRLKIDDPVDASAVHGACGVWGLLAAALFDWGKGFDHYHGWSGFGCMTGDDGACSKGIGGSAIAAQLVMIVAIIAWAGTLSTLSFLALRFSGLLRIDDHTEKIGYDMHSHSPPKAYAFSGQDPKLEDSYTQKPVALVTVRLGLGVSFLLQNSGVLPKYDMLVQKLKEEEAEEKSEERRLREAAPWDFEPFNMSGWPSDLVQHAESLSCSHGEEGRRIFVATDQGSSVWSVSAFANQLQRFEGQALRADRGVEQLTVASATICPPKEVRTSCFLARAVGSRLSLRSLTAGSEPAEEIASFQVEMGQLRKLTGAVVRCGGLSAGSATTEDRWCLLLAGWDGRRLPVAAVPFDDSGAASPIVPLFDVFANWIDSPEAEGSCPASGSAPAPAVLSSNGRLAVFDLHEGQLMDMWLPRWPAQPRHLCAAGAGGSELLFLGQEKFRLGMWRASLPGQLQG
eukprot:s8330_g1.t1